MTKAMGLTYSDSTEAVIQIESSMDPQSLWSFPWPIKPSIRLPESLDICLEKDGEWFIAYCREVPEANGQGTTKAAALDDLMSAILLVIQDQLESRFRDTRIHLGAAR